MPKKGEITRKKHAAEKRNTLVQMRRGLKMSQAEISKATGIEQSRFSRWENGQIDLDENQIQKIKDAIDAVITQKSNAGMFSVGTPPSQSSVENGRAIAGARRMSGITQTELARKAGFAVSSISTFENGYIEFSAEEC